MTQADSVHSTPPTNTSAIDDQQSLHKPRAEPQDPFLYVPTGISPETIFAATGGLRMSVEAEIERLLNFLDQLDDDPDLEPAGDELEPDLGSVAGRREVDQTTWAAGEMEADEADDEPSLGSIEDHPNGYHDCSDFGHGRSQERWASGSSDDREGEHDGGEPDVDDEPSLAAPENHIVPSPAGIWMIEGQFKSSTGGQMHWAQGGLHDDEGDEHDGREPEDFGGEAEREDDELSGDENEPSLGSFDRLLNQEHAWRQTQGGWGHTNSDAEHDPAG